MSIAKLPYDTFNARSLSFEEVARTFLENDQFSNLTRNNNSLLMGPRGSGKTTLLKMLTPQCQYTWKNKIIENYDLPFFGIYVYSDTLWKQQNDYLEEQLRHKPKELKLILQALVACDCLNGALESFEALVNYYYSGDRDDLEYKLCSELVKLWKLPTPISPTFISLGSAINERVLAIDNLVNKLIDGVAEISHDKFEEYFFDSYFNLLRTSCRAFSSLVRQDPFFKKTRRSWALCFDELEIAPTWLRKDLMRRLRGADQNLVLKLTTSPMVSFSDELELDSVATLPMEDQDYKVVRTWVWNESQLTRWRDFANELTRFLILKRTGKNLEPIEIFGDDSFDRNMKESFDYDAKTPKYGRNSLEYSLFKEQALLDASFRRFLERKGVNPVDPRPDMDSVSQRDTIFRKIKPVVLFRYQYGIEGIRRSRKNPALYYGINLIYDLCDGNPRALIGIVEDLLTELREDKEGRLIPLSIRQQNDKIQEISRHYLELTTSHPEASKIYVASKKVASHIRSKGVVNLGKIIEVIGEHFKDKLYGDSFYDEPATCFTISSKLNPDVKKLIEFGVQLGTIIYLNPVAAGGVSGKKFRLAYLLHPNFRLMKREHGSASLENMVQKDNPQNLEQKTLFDED